MVDLSNGSWENGGSSRKQKGGRSVKTNSFTGTNTQILYIYKVFMLLIIMMIKVIAIIIII